MLKIAYVTNYVEKSEFFEFLSSKSHQPIKRDLTRIPGQLICIMLPVGTPIDCAVLCSVNYGRTIIYFFYNFT